MIAVQIFKTTNRQKRFFFWKTHLPMLNNCLFFTLFIFWVIRSSIVCLQVSTITWLGADCRVLLEKYIPILLRNKKYCYVHKWPEFSYQAQPSRRSDSLISLKWGQQTCPKGVNDVDINHRLSYVALCFKHAQTDLWSHCSLCSNSVQQRNESYRVSHPTCLVLVKSLIARVSRQARISHEKQRDVNKSYGRINNKINYG